MDGKAMRAVDAVDEIGAIRSELEALAQLTGQAGDLDSCGEGIAFLLGGMADRLGACVYALSAGAREQRGAEVLEMADGGVRPVR